MTWVVDVHAVHSDGRVVERAAHPCPVLVGRDAALSTVVLEGDSCVSKMHASVDVSRGRLLACDVHSTNGTHTTIGRLAPDQWTDLGGAEEERELVLGSWRVRVRGRNVPEPRAAVRTVLDPEPFGATQAPTVMGVEIAALAERLSAIVDRLSEPAHAVRISTAALDSAVARELEATAAPDRASLARALVAQFPELQRSSALAPFAAREVPEPPQVGGPPPPPPAETAALAGVQDLARWYVDPVRVPVDAQEVATFLGRLKAAVDALVTGLFQSVAGRDAHIQKMHLAPEGGAMPHGETLAAFARTIFDWKSVQGGGPEVVRRAFADLSIHHMAFFNATCSGIRDLLDELSPETLAAQGCAIERRAPWRGLIEWLRGPRALLDAYRRRHRELATEESERFALLFGARFAEEYRAFVRETQVVPVLPPVSAPSNAPAAAPAPEQVAPTARGATVLCEPAHSPPAPRRVDTVPLAPAAHDPRRAS